MTILADLGNNPLHLLQASRHHLASVKKYHIGPGLRCLFGYEHSRSKVCRGKKKTWFEYSFLLTDKFQLSRHLSVFVCYILLIPHSLSYVSENLLSWKGMIHKDHQVQILALHRTPPRIPPCARQHHFTGFPCFANFGLDFI